MEPSNSHPAAGHPTTSTHSAKHPNAAESAGAAFRQISHTHLQLTSPAVTYEPPLRSAPLPHPLPHYSLALASPIEALADAAMTSQQISQAFVEPPRHPSYPSHPTTSPVTIPESMVERAPRHAFGQDLTYAYNERPAKRARSEIYGSPHYAQAQSRPATSHIPGWSYNVEHMVDSGMRMYQDSRPSTQHQSGSGEDRISDAQLLLDFFNTSVHTAQTPPSTTKRWSLSHAELPTKQTQQVQEPPSPYKAPLPPAIHYPQPAQASMAVQHPPEPPSLPPTVTEPAPAAQTHTPPEETSKVAADSTMQDSTTAEDTKPKKHQGWPKGKPRGPRGTPSTGKRKRSTPKPKSASSASTSAAADQLQSPLSLPTEQLGVVQALDAALPRQAGNSTLEAPLQGRRHSFSNSAAPLANRESLPTYQRAQSLPLNSQPVTPAAPTKVPLPTKKVAVEQPDLICAACKSSESEIKVGDGEQWVGCDGCKEWYHYACAGFNSEREVRDVNKFYCEPCRPKFGETTSRSTDAHWGHSSNLVQRFGNPSEPTQLLTTPA